MRIIARHITSIVLLPGTVLILVPWWLLHGGGYGWPTQALAFAGAAVGGVAFAAGLLLFVRCVTLFALVGRGTLAPWDPTRHLVATGPYARMRNPMITGVAAMLLGEALYFGAWQLAVWLVAFVIINHVYFIAVEEPALRRRFGPPYIAYTADVPRWWPRLH